MSLDRINRALLYFSILSFLLTGLVAYYSSNLNINEKEETDRINLKIADAVVSAKKAIDTYAKEERNKSSDISDNHNIYVFDDGDLTFWTQTEFVPTYRDIAGDYDIKFIRTARNDYMAIKRTEDDREIVATIIIHHDYKIENEYFKSGFSTDFFTSQNLRIQNSNSENKICFEGNCLFSIEYLSDYYPTHFKLDIISVSLFFLGFFTLMLAVYRMSLTLAATNFPLALGVLFGSLTIIRYLMLELSWPNALIDHDLFDSRVFASSAINASFTDLFINLIILLVFVGFLFYRFQRSIWFRKILRLSTIRKSLIGFLLAGLFIFSFHWLYLVFQTIYHNSQISFDINQSISFENNRLVAFFCYLLFTLSIILLAHLSFRSLRRTVKNNGAIVSIFLIAVALFSLINIFLGQDFIASAIISIILFFVLLKTNLARAVSRISFSTFLYLFVLLIASSALGAWSIFHFENESEVDRKKKFANQFLIDKDHMAEFLLSVINEKIKNDIFIQSRLASPFLSKDIVESKIREVYLNNYFDKYDIKIYIYNSIGEAFEEGSNSGSKMLRLDSDQYRTGYEGIYFINLPEEGATKRYLDYIEIKRRGIKVGYILIDMRLKRIVPENVYPEMLVDNRFLSPFQDANYSYAVFNNMDVAYSSGDFNYNDMFVKQSNFNTQDEFTFNRFRHVAVNDQAGHRLVISSTDHPLTDLISNFSFLFLIKVFILLLIIASYSVSIWWRKSELSYSARIQLYLNIAFFLPLIAVSATTLSLINASFEKEVIDEYYKKAENVGNNLSAVLSDFINQKTNEDELQQAISNIARFSNTDINVFDVSGQLIATNQPAIYDNDLLSDYVNYEAYEHIVQQGEKAFTAKEKVGNLEYNATYFGVKSFDTGAMIGLVSIPFFDSEYALQQSQIVVITNIINVFTFVFIVFLIISNFATRWLTFPLAFITQKLKKTSLTEFNEPLNWNADDEIGLMVGEYNKMLLNLEDSKRALAKSEKQSAWREIAQQVAHEIKNPLTPMKLTLQHLSRKLIGDDKEEDKSKPIDSLLKQIETLDDIASSFSSFAKMPIPESARYELSSVIKSTVSLHSATQNLKINLQLPNEEVYTIGDEQLMGRIVSNLILNAVQANDKETTLLDIVLEAMKEKIVLSFVDNGAGIHEEIRQKVFIPNFTTKTTGSGIGLAIAKHGIEHAGGKIWFESEMGEGASFFIELPRVSNE